jgi:predicted transcriptional regulator
MVSKIPRTPGRRAAGELEGDILAALWAAGAPLSPAEVLTAVGGDLAYNTVHTILTRLVDKGLLMRVVTGHGPAYQPTRDAEDMAVERMRTALAAVSNRTAALQRFVTSLDAADEATLRALLGDGP